MRTRCSLRTRTARATRTCSQKKLSLFTGPERAWAPEVPNEAMRKAGVRYILSAANDTHHNTVGLPKEFVNSREMKQHTFLVKLSHAKVLMGMGHPMMFVLPVSGLFAQSLMRLFDRSPTSDDALCLGIPFINPVREVSIFCSFFDWTHSCSR